MSKLATARTADTTSAPHPTAAPNAVPPAPRPRLHRPHSSRGRRGMLRGMADRWSVARASIRPHREFAGESDRLYTLEERMRVYNASAVAVAVVDGGEIVVDTCVGQLAADDPTPADTNTVFGASSISKA